MKYWCNNQLHSCLTSKLLTEIGRLTSILTFQGHPRSKVIAKNESPHMISYLCVIQTKSVSVIVFEIIAIKALFDLSRSKVKSQKRSIFSSKHWYKHSFIKWRWFKHEKVKIFNFDLSRSLKVKVIIKIGSLVLISMHDYHINISNSLRDIATQIYRKFEFDLSGSSKVKFHCTKWKPMYDFLSPHYWNQVCISYRFRVIWQNNSHKLKYGAVNFDLCRGNYTSDHHNIR